MANGMQMILELFPQGTSREQTSGASDSLARTSALPESKLDFTETVQACFSELCIWLGKSQKKKDPLTCSLRTLKICLVLMEDGILPDFSLKWTGGGTMRNGRFSTANTSEFHKTGNAVLLSDILEKQVPQKYFLSKGQTERIIFTESGTEKDTGETHKSLSQTELPKPLTQEQVGGRGPHTVIPVLTPGKTNTRQNGRRFKEDGDEAFTLTCEDRHGVMVEVEPMEMSGNELSKSDNEAHSLNCSDQRKVFGAHQTRTMVGYNCARNSGGGDDPNRISHSVSKLQRTARQTNDDNRMFAVDKGIRVDEERDVANCIESREDRGLSARKREGTLICLTV